MMDIYESPQILENDEIAEGVFTASGDCYTTTARIHQRPETGREDFRIQVDAIHSADHNSNAQQLVLTFSDPVEYVSSAGTYVSGSGTNAITINYSYHNNRSDNIGLGDVVVTSKASGLSITGAVVYDIGKY